MFREIEKRTFKQLVKLMYNKEEEKQYIEQNLLYIDVEAHHNMLIFYKRGNTTFDSPRAVKNLAL